MTKQPVTLTVTYRIVTPMFCAGADQNTAELRLPSFKGALRFWWRSLMSGKVNNHRELHQREAELFGASDSKTGQSKVSMRFIDCKLGKHINKGEALGNGLTGAAYLGYGVMNFNAILDRSAIANGGFAVECRFSRLASDSQIEDVRASLILLGTTGGLGSKARKGYGSLTLQDLRENDESQQLPNSPADILRTLVQSRSSQIPTWTAWSQSSRVVTLSTGQGAIGLLDRCGRLLANYRLWHGENQSHFADDHDLLFQYLRDGEKPDRLPRRIAFGLPHNYFFRSLSDRDRRLNVKAEVTPEKLRDGGGLTRRGSPLFIHIHEFQGEAPIAVFAFLPARYLPEPANVMISDTSAKGQTNRTRHRPVTLQIETVDFWNPITSFLEYLKSVSDVTLQEVDLD
jgi:CRISPR-associated protein Cmr1